MPTVSERLSLQVNTGDLQSRLGSQVEFLQQSVRASTQLIDNPPRGIEDFIAQISALQISEFTIGGSLTAALNKLGSILPADISQIVGPARAQFGELESLVNDQLRPLLQDAVRAAGAVQQLLSVQLGCRSAGPAPPQPPGGPPPSPPNQGEARLQATSQQLAQVDTLLDSLPMPLEPRSFVQLVVTLVSSKPRDQFFTINLPVIDDLLNPLQTLAAWEAMTADELGDEIVANLTTFTARLDAVAAGHVRVLGADIAAQLGHIRSADVAAAVDALLAGYNNLNSALQGGDVVAAEAAVPPLSAAIDTYESLTGVLTADILADLPPLLPRLQNLASDLLDQLAHLLVLLEPTYVSGRLASLATFSDPVSPAAMQSVKEVLAPVLNWLNDLIQQLDFSSLTEPIATISETARGISEQISAAFAGVAANVQALLQEVRDAIAGVGLDDLRNSLLAQIEQSGALINTQMTRAFAPARQSIASAISVLSEAVGRFDPEEITAALQQVVQSLADVLNAADVQDAIQTIKSTVDSVTQVLQQQSFAPATDEVIALIEKMTSGLRAALNEDLNQAAQTAIIAGLSLLPDDLQGVTDPIVADFGNLLAQGPVSLLERIRDEPKKLLDVVKQFEPQSLISPLTAPYRQLLDKVDDFQVRQLFQRANQEFEAQKGRLEQTAPVGQALQAVSAPLDRILSRLDALSPAALFAPLQEELQAALGRIIDASPVDEILDVVKGVFATIHEALEVGNRLRSISGKLSSWINSLGDSRQQVDAWRDGILDTLSGLANPAAIDAALQGMQAKVEATRHANLLSAFDSATQPVQDALGQLEPGLRLSRLVTAHGAAKTRVPALPDSPLKSSLQALLVRFDPLQPESSAPLRRLEAFRQGIADARAGFVAVEVEWNDQVTGLDSALAHGGSTPPALRQLVSELIEPILQPIRALFQILELASTPLSGIASTVDELITKLTTTATQLLTGPESLESIATAVQQVVDQLRNVDLGFLSSGLEEAMVEVRTQVRSLDPAQLAIPLQAALHDALRAVSLEGLISGAQVAELDAALRSVSETLRGVDPAQLITSAVQPLFDQTVLPLLDAFDLSPVFQALLVFLESLKEELTVELRRVNDAYRSFRSLSSAGASASVSIGG